MENILIYGGAAVMLVGCVFGLIGAIKGFRNKKGLSAFMLDFNAQMDPDVRKYVITWGILMTIGFMIVGIGISLVL